MAPLAKKVPDSCYMLLCVNGKMYKVKNFLIEANLLGSLPGHIYKNALKILYRQ